MAQEIEEGKDYKVSQFRGNDPAQTKYDNYECTRCQFSTLYFDKMTEHYDWESKHNHHWAFPVGSPEAAAAPGARKVDHPQLPLKY